VAEVANPQETEVSEAEVVNNFAKTVFHAGQFFFLSNHGIEAAQDHFDRMLALADALPKIDGKSELGLSLESGSSPRIVDIEVKVAVRDA
jgi:hypothetical protein